MKGVKRNAALLALLIAVVTGGNMLYTAHVLRANSQQRCTSLRADASIPLPPPQPGYNARTWEAAYEAIAGARARQLGCPPVKSGQILRRNP